MKSLLIVTTIAIFSLGNQSYATGNSELNNKIESIKLDQGSILSSNDKQADFVKVSFRVSENGNLEILELNYSDQRLKDLLVKKLETLEIAENHDSEEIHYYKFSFELI